ncbi:DUF4153 domain-containing protein [Thalassotalea litorea]|uniref:DUF4153 domain-containing protein n=1 Tax=Thalassotalea litorea TaxID=2020715 RepID=A0A5R9IND3_9GAMM|nr:DUF4153 domain-containing protein [Thalassotalea litorea]TLU66782.1 DUF4153 domain-containing protein [Thalassotalea litorea]
MDKQLPKLTTLSISLLQGIALWFLYYSFEQQIFPATNPIWFNPLATLSIALPVLLQLSATPQNWQRLLIFLALFGIVLSLTASYIGYQQIPVAIIESGSMQFIFIVTTGIAAFKAIMYGQLWSEKSKLDYQRLFQLSWRNFLIAAESLLFTGIFYGILNLGAALFNVIGIDVFSQLLEKPWFNIPVLCMAFGFAVITFRRIAKTVDIIANILQTLIKFLLPLLAVVALAFVITLPFTGLQKLWDTGYGSTLLLSLQAMTLFFVNAVYQNHQEQRAYPIFWHRFIYLSIAILPIFSVISAYGLWLRIDQYGWTVSRCWGVVAWSILTCFCLGYLQGILRERDHWLRSLSWVNVRMGLIVLALMLLVNSPLLNFQQISTQSQLKRVADNVIDIDQLDTYYFKWSLARQGYIGLQELKDAINDEQFSLKIDRLYAPKRDAQQQVSQQEFFRYVDYWPEQHTFPEELKLALFEKENNRWFRPGQQGYYLLAIDLNKDGLAEYISVKESTQFTDMNIWRLDEQGKWQNKYLYRNNPASLRGNKTDIQSLLQANKVQAVEPKWQDLLIGDIRIQISF